ncbi:MAG: hypothetical protein ACT6QU_15530 [Aliihoeflea sp.]|uniref:hypothetical protein n=1 Tax=Aliihoeflea sp. TaxID=2608088 RepID=UPI004033C54E
MIVTLFIAAAFVIGFLIGENRAVRQANDILDANTKVLLEAIGGEPPAIADLDEVGDDRPTLH